MKKTNETLPALPTENLPAEATQQVDSGFSANDISFPKLWLMQGLSDAVSDGKAKMGDFLNSATGEIIADSTTGVNIIPIHMTKISYISKLDTASGKYEFAYSKPVLTVEEEKLPWDFEENGQKFKRDLARVFYVLLESDPTIPFIISLRGTSAKTGQKLATQMYIMNKMQAPNAFFPAISTIKVTGKKDKNDKGTFFVWDISPVSKTKPELIEAASNWYSVVKQMDIKEQMGPVATTAAPVEVPKDSNGKDIF